MINAVPLEMQSHPQWVAWKLESEGSKKPKKVPYNIKTEKPCNVTNRANWNRYEDVVDALHSGKGYSGIGIALPPAGEIFGIDLDDAFQQNKPRVDAQAIINRLETYGEISPSGRGIHLYGHGRPLTYLGRQTFPLGTIAEFYPRYLTFTGNQLDGTPAILADCREAANSLFQESAAVLSPEQSPMQTTYETIPTNLPIDSIVYLAKRGRNGSVFWDLWTGKWKPHYTSQSEADIRLCGILAFYTGRDAEYMLDVFRASSLYREKKWDSVHCFDGRTYGQATVHKSCSTCKTIYTNHRHVKKPKPADVAKEFLRELLCNGPLPATEIMQIADERGIDERTLKRAKEGIAFSYKERSWYWKLRDTAQEEHSRVPNLHTYTGGIVGECISPSSPHNGDSEYNTHVADKTLNTHLPRTDLVLPGRTAEQGRRESTTVISSLSRYNTLYKAAANRRLPYDRVELATNLYSVDPADSVCYWYNRARFIINPKNTRQQENLAECLRYLDALLAWWKIKSHRKKPHR